jgi:hypothetical protein
MNEEPTYNLLTFKMLMSVYEYMCDGRIYLAREQLEKLLNINLEVK